MIWRNGGFFPLLIQDIMTIASSLTAGNNPLNTKLAAIFAFISRENISSVKDLEEQLGRYFINNRLQL